MSILSIANLQKRYTSPEGEKASIVNVQSFELAEGAQVAIHGPSGCGKTTFLNLIAGILRADTGTITIAGREMAAGSESSRDRLRAETIGYVHQTFNLLQGYTALDNVILGMMFGSGVDPAYARALLESVGLGDRLHYRPRQLSVGQQQRVAIARALANRPVLVLADEPTGNLDRRHAEQALDLLTGLCKERGSALILVSHDATVLERFECRYAFADINRSSIPSAVSK